MRDSYAHSREVPVRSLRLLPKSAVPSHKRRFGLREVRSLPCNEIIWDTSVVGFYARRQRGEAITYGVKYRTKTGEQRWYRIGRHGAPWTPDTARAEAKRILGEAVAGHDPARISQAARRDPTVAQLCNDYLAQLETGRILTRNGRAKQPTTLSTDRSRIASHILPLLGARKVSGVTTEDIEQFMHDVIEGKASRRKYLGSRRVSNVRGGRGAAARTVGLLGAIFTYAVRTKLRLDNPVRGIIRPADGQRHRRLGSDEYALLGAGLNGGNAWPHAIAAARFLAVTGWRTGEVLNLRWNDLDLNSHTAHLKWTKTGASVRPLSDEAISVLEKQRASVSESTAGGLVFPASRGSGSMTGFPRMFGRVVRESGLPADITPHVLRHSFASVASDLGYSEVTIACLIGHKGGGVTRRYIHSADAVLVSAANGVAAEISKLLYANL